MARRPGLGKGLDALIPGGFQATQNTISKENIQQIAIELISPNPRQPRTDFNNAELTELSASIKTHGILQPLVISPIDNSGYYNLIAGERRLRAAQLAGLSSVPAILRTVNEQEQLEIALIENIQRKDLNPLEQAMGYKQLMDDFSLTHDDISKQVGKSRTAITNTMRLLNLADEVKKALLQGDISEGHARSLLGLNTSKAQAAALDTIRGLGLNVRQTENLVSKLNGRKPDEGTPKTKPAEVIDLEDRLRRHFKTKVNLNSGKNGGTITIFFFSDEELNAILDQIF